MLNLSALVTKLSPSHLTLGLLLVIAAILGLTPLPSDGAGTVTDCASFGPGPGTLGTALSGGGLVTFACSGTIIVPGIVIDNDTAIDATGQTITLSGNDSTTVFYVYNARLDLVNVTVTAGAYDGGIHAISATVTLTHTTVSGNSATYGGGGIGAFLSDVTLINSTVSGNSAGPGGGLVLDSSSGTLIRSTVSGNSADMGGAIIMLTSTVTLTNTTVTANETKGTGALVAWDNTTLTLKNTIVANQTYGWNCQGAISQGYNLDSDGTCGLTAGGDLSSVDPLLGPLQDNGGATWTVGTLASGGSATLTITATVLGSGNYLNTATATSTTYDPVTSNNTATATTTPVGVAVPTMTEWGMILLTVLLGIGSVYYLRGRRLAS